MLASPPPSPTHLFRGVRPAYGWVLREINGKPCSKPHTVQRHQVSQWHFGKLKVLHPKYRSRSKPKVQVQKQASQRRGWPGSGWLYQMVAFQSPFGSECDCCVGISSKKEQAGDNGCEAVWDSTPFVAQIVTYSAKAGSLNHTPCLFDIFVNV